MTESHDPVQFVKQFHQILVADRLLLGFFFGAGCPCAIRVPQDNTGDTLPLIGDIHNLTATVSDALSASNSTADAFRKLQAILHEDRLPQPTIETMLSRIRSLRDAAGAASVRGLSAADLQALDLQVCKTILTAVDKPLPRTDTPYHRVADFAGRFRTPPLEIFTTNYDLLIEQALEARRIPFFDGFVGAFRPFFDQQSIEDDTLSPRWTLLWKLHGSINWRFAQDTKVISRSTNPSDGDELLIHPSHLKYDESRRMPYLVMIDRLKNFLRNAKRPVALFVVGHSFGDEHLNATLLESLRANPSATCYALQFSTLDNYAAPVPLALSQANFNVLASDEAIIRRRRGNWIAGPATDIASLDNAFEFTAQQASADASGPKPTTTNPQDESRPCRFLLGDFCHFGHFVQRIAGLAPSSDPQGLPMSVSS